MQHCRSERPAFARNSGDLLRPPLVVVATDRHRGARRGLGWQTLRPPAVVLVPHCTLTHIREEGGCSKAIGGVLQAVGAPHSAGSTPGIFRML